MRIPTLQAASAKCSLRKCWPILPILMPARGKSTECRLSPRTRCLGLVPSSGPQLDVNGSNSQFLKRNRLIYVVWNPIRLTNGWLQCLLKLALQRTATSCAASIAAYGDDSSPVCFDLHATGDPDKRLSAWQIGDVHECVVEGGKDMSHAINKLSLACGRSQCDILFCSTSFLFGGHTDGALDRCKFTVRLLFFAAAPMVWWESRPMYPARLT